MNIKELRTFLGSTTARLAGTYLAIIMCMSVGFSAVFYNTSAHQLGRQLPPSSLYDDKPRHDTSGAEGSNPDAKSGHELVEEFLQSRINEGRRELLLRLIWLNFGALLTGSVISYYLARRTLQPIEEAMEAQSQFVSDASHELRTPLTTLQTTNEVALRRKELSPAEARELLEYNVAEAIKLKTLTDALLGLLKGDHQTLTVSAHSVSDIVSDAINAAYQLADAKHIAISDTVSQQKVLVDRISLIQVMTILLDNAIKYSPDGTTVTVSSSQKGKAVYISVEDKGAGIKASDIPHIFRRFYRADKSRTSQQANGYGLGLAIADKLIKQNDGHISVVSTHGKGSTFTIKLPAA